VSLMGRSIQSLLFQLLGQASVILTGVILARTLGPAGKGLVGYAAVALFLITVFFNGQSEAIAYQVGRRGIPMIKVATATLRLLCGIVPILILAVLAIAEWVPHQNILVASAIALPFTLVAQLCVPYLLAYDKIKTVNYQTFVTNGSYFLMVTPAVLIFHADVPYVLALWIVSNALGMSYGLWHVLPLLKTQPPHHEALNGVTASDDAARNEGALEAAELAPQLIKEADGNDRRIAREQFVFMAKSGLAEIAGSLNLRIDVFIVSFMLGAQALGIYTLAVATGELMWRVSAAIVWSSLGRIANSPQPEAARIVAKITRHIFTVQLLGGIAAFIFGPLLIPLVYGGAFAPASNALRFLVPGLIAYTMEGAIGYFITVQMGKPLLRLRIQVLSVILCTIVSILAIPHLGIAGAALATSISYLVVISVVSGIFLKHTKLPLKDLFLLSPAEVVRLREYALSRLTARFKGKVSIQEATTEG
jgi:O-antigen/teichoic acid export membrane protein